MCIKIFIIQPSTADTHHPQPKKKKHYVKPKQRDPIVINERLYCP